MSKQEFLKKLENKLRKLKKEEREKYVEYYDEIISDVMEKGISEEEAIAKQGSIEQIAEEILANTNPENIQNKDWRGIVLVIVSIIMVACCMIPLALGKQFQMQMNASVGIIGGADGPTSIFVAGKMGVPWGIYVATIIVLVVTVAYFAKKYKKK